jgi:hypothetical protein
MASSRVILFMAISAGHKGACFCVWVIVDLGDALPVDALHIELQYIGIVTSSVAFVNAELLGLIRFRQETRANRESHPPPSSHR